MIKKSQIFSFILILIIALSIGIFVQSRLSGDANMLTIGDTAIGVEIADTPRQRSKGLSGRLVLSPNYGLLFIFENPDFHNFWMKDMNFPIDIIWIDEEYKIIDITKNLSPDTFPQRVTSKEKAKYILEVNARFSDIKNIKIGDTINF